MKRHKPGNISMVRSISLSLIVILAVGCKGLIDVDPPINQVVGQDIYNNNATAISVVTGIYTRMSNEGIFTGSGSISLRIGLAADELNNTTEPSDILNSFYINSFTNNGNQLFWGSLYSNVFQINSALEGISSSNGITSSVKTQLLGETKFLRAFMYFYLVNMYGNVPVLLNTDIKINSTAPRSDISVVYDQIINDLKDAEQLLNEEYVSSDVSTKTTERVRPNKYSAAALLARVYLYYEKWADAEAEATKVIENTALFGLENLELVFLKNSREAILQLQPVVADLNTFDGTVFILAEGDGQPPGPNGFGSGRPVYLSDEIYNSFENGDKRKQIWTDTVNVLGIRYPYAYKYKEWRYGQGRTEYLMVLRLGEQYLIRAEARARQGNINGASSAASDLNEIRRRASLPELSYSQVDIFESILNERKSELFTEWGHRWFDIIRMGKIDNIMEVVCPRKGGIWAPYKKFFPIPVEDIKGNPSLKGHQNPGYPEI